MRRKEKTIKLGDGRYFSYEETDPSPDPQDDPYEVLAERYGTDRKRLLPAYRDLKNALGIRPSGLINTDLKKLPVADLLNVAKAAKLTPAQEKRLLAGVGVRKRTF